MHLVMILIALAVAWWLRSSWRESEGTWNLRWRRSLFLFLFPPLLIFMTAIAVLFMGPKGNMGGMYTGSISCILALIYLGIFAILCIQLAFQGWQSVESARNCPLVNLGDRRARLLQTEAMFAGQIGFWQPELVVSVGLLQTLSPNHLESVLAHEQGHYQYRDTFWFFWLGWVRSCTAWLPNTEPLWQELLVLRELRADSYAALQVDPLVLAESLLLVVSTSPLSSEICCAALGSPSADRLEQRVEALLAPPEPTTESQLQSWHTFLLAFLPLVSVIFHT
ncbi:M56 family metallopeptidase [Desmonostoc muscorum LEGE 12446]|uniref:M48 family metalloprotease n=1 Tax=Desmonostoc muscorum LEGE 12446 TaxID=1828758 RepID=A0A8J7DJL4_DESMC|nr:M56 family metallopeptidase [Desmonostoc muscorum]MCF2146685.1 M56 family metallopeptidase [Desmonostoc muscorum LEGE 12446]